MITYILISSIISFTVFFILSVYFSFSSKITLWQICVGCALISTVVFLGCISVHIQQRDREKLNENTYICDGIVIDKNVIYFNENYKGLPFIKYYKDGLERVQQCSTLIIKSKQIND